MTPVEQIVKNSLEIIKLKLYKQSLLFAKSRRADCGVLLYHDNFYIEMFNNIDDRIYTINQQIKKLLLEIIGDKKIIGYDEYSKYWAISGEELKKGYLTLEEQIDPNNDLSGSRDLILFLSDYKDDRNTISAGSLLPKKKVAHLLGNQKSLINEVLTKRKSLLI